MSYRLRFDSRFMRQLEALPGDVRSVARRAIRELADDPFPAGAKELEEHIVDLLHVGPKSADLYERLGLGHCAAVARPPALRT